MPPELVLNLLSKKWIYAQVPPINGTRKGTILHHRLSWSIQTNKAGIPSVIPSVIQHINAHKAMTMIIRITINLIILFWLELL